MSELDRVVPDFAYHKVAIEIALFDLAAKAQNISVAELLGGKKFQRRITLKAPLKRPAEYRIVGQPIPRIDLPRKISGAASFVHDVRLPGMLHARVVRPPSPGAKLISLDESSVPAVLVVHLNNFIAVVAEREEQAVDAAQQLKVTWRETAHWPKQADLYSFIRRQPTTDEVLVKEGAITAAFKRAARHLTATYAQPFQAHASIGPACAVADVQADRAVIWSNSQGVFPLRGALAELLKMSPNQVQVIHAEGAGSYGHNGSDDAAADAAILSQAVGKPVRVQWSRQDEFRWEPYAPAMVMEVSGGLDRQGRIIAWKYEVWTPSHMGRPRGKSQLLAGQLIYGQRSSRPQWFGGGDRNAPTNYHFANQRVVAHWLARLPLRTSSMRSLGGAANTFANESFMDELAFAAQIDPLELRLRHLTDLRAIAVLKAVAQQSGWGKPLPAGEGRGLAFAQYENDVAYVATVAQVHVDTGSGAIQVQRIVTAHDCGLIINPDGLRNQIEGNVLQSLSRALYEEVTFDQSHITSIDWDSYPILKFSDVPEVEVVLINHPDEPAVGAGEPATITTAPAIANAIFHATGLRMRQIPFTPQRIMTALG